MKINYSLFPGRKLKKEKYKIIDEPIISIITPYYNTNKYIDTTVNCVLNQTYPNFEWIIIDDGSTIKEDIEKLDEIQKLDERIKVFHKENEGPAAARDYGVEKTNKNSKYLVFLDSDDLINETYLECAYWTLETNKGASWAYTDCINFDGEEFTWTKWYNPKKEMKDNILVMTAMIRKDAFLKVNGFEIKEKNVYEDWCLWLKMIREKMYPVRMNFYGFWYRKKPLNESQLKQSNETNKEKAMSYIEKIVPEIKEPKDGIQYPKEDYNWEIIEDKKDKIIVPKLEENKKIKILMIIPWMTMGGADKFNLDLIKKINKDKFEFIIVSTEPSQNEWRQEFEEYATVYDLTTFLDRKDWISFINYIIEKNNINVIFNTNSTFGYACLPYLKSKYPQIPIMDYIHMEEWYNRNGGYSRDSSMISSVIDRTLVCNANSEKILVDHFKRKKEDVKTIYIGVDEKKFDSKKYNKKELFNKYNIEENKKYIISYICRISEQKRPMLLVEIINNISKKRKDCLFIIAGDGPLLNKMKKKVKEYNLNNYVKYVGKVQDTEEIYSISDITINCSIKEGLALTAYESLSMEVPVVSCDVGGQKELINDKVGIIVPCIQKEEEIWDFKYSEEEIDSYVNAINKIIEKIDEYKSNARKRIVDDGFTIDKMIENMEKEFLSVYNDPNENKIDNAKFLMSFQDVLKELITKYYISTQKEYYWMAENYNKNFVDIDWKYEKEKMRMLFYETTLEYKIKHPFVVILKSIGLYNLIRKILKKGE